MALFVVVGAGPVGREVARLLVAEGHSVRLISRTGMGIPGDGVENVHLDARDGEALARISSSAEAIFMCAMAPYTRWPTDFPPIMDGVLTAAKRVGARLLIAGNVYGYGEQARSTLTPDLPLAPTSIKGRVRVAMWRSALSSGVPVIEVRASDYLGQGAGSLFTLAGLPSLLAGNEVVLPGDMEVPHAWTFTKDVARTLVAASRYSGDWGRAFHVPSWHVSVRGLVHRFSISLGVIMPDLRSLSLRQVSVLAQEDELMREIGEIYYLLEKPYFLDATDTERLLGVVASSPDLLVEDTLSKVV